MRTHARERIYFVAALLCWTVNLETAALRVATLTVHASAVGHEYVLCSHPVAIAHDRVKLITCNVRKEVECVCADVRRSFAYPSTKFNSTTLNIISMFFCATNLL